MLEIMIDSDAFFNLAVENDLIVLNHPDMQVIFTQFFDTVWNGECGEVLSSKEEIDSFIEQILHRISILESVE